MLITKEILNNLRKHQQKEHFGSEAKAMFVDGVFSSDNWNGGDGIIRQYFYDFGYLEQKAAEIEGKYNSGDFEGDIIINHQVFNDQSYVMIVIKGYVYSEGDFTKEVEDNVYFTWYKNRGRTENALYNSKPMTEEQYLFVINALEQTGFEFNLGL